jgi:hypothetical protein
VEVSILSASFFGVLSFYKVWQAFLESWIRNELFNQCWVLFTFYMRIIRFDFDLENII